MPGDDPFPQLPIDRGSDYWEKRGRLGSGTVSPIALSTTIRRPTQRLDSLCFLEDERATLKGDSTESATTPRKGRIIILYDVGSCRPVYEHDVMDGAGCLARLLLRRPPGRTHLPCRSWCKSCVREKAGASQVAATSNITVDDHFGRRTVASSLTRTQRRISRCYRASTSPPGWPAPEWCRRGVSATTPLRSDAGSLWSADLQGVLEADQETSIHAVCATSRICQLHWACFASKR